MNGAGKEALIRGVRMRASGGGLWWWVWEGVYMNGLKSEDRLRLGL